jgi:hypothetical protein
VATDKDPTPHGAAPPDTAPPDTAPKDTAPKDPLSLLSALMVLTLVSGLVDAVSYLGLGHVFTANMTGNVVVLGFAAAGAPGFSAPATLTSLGLFLVGAIIGGRFAGRFAGRSRLLVVTMIAEAVLVGGAALAAWLAGTTTGGWGRYSVIAMLAGAAAGALMYLHVDAALPLLVSATLTGATAAAFGAIGARPAASPVAGSTS